MRVLPLRFQPTASNELLFVDDTGGFFRSDDRFLERYARGFLSRSDMAFLESNGHTVGDRPLDTSSAAYRYAKRLFRPGKLDYVILVPSLRCNLACSYCQVARAPSEAKGFDWTEETTAAVLRLLSDLETDRVKIEFQGGEPLLRLDILDTVRSFCRGRFAAAEFIVCTNLQKVSNDAWRFLSDDDTSVSTSLDGDAATHVKQRSRSAEAHAEFAENLHRAVATLGRDRVSAIATISPDDAPDPELLIDAFAGFGLRSMFVRPVNHQGFARKRYATERHHQWNAYHSALVDALVKRNAVSDIFMEEYYFSHCLRRVMRAGQDNHVDLRNPNPMGSDYLVVDYDGTIYPTDEARMVSRIGQMDLSIGSVFDGVNRRKTAELDSQSLNTLHEDCIHCAYQPFCGVDMVDDLSRYGRIDVVKLTTSHCQRHTAIFNKVFEFLYSDDPDVRKSVAGWLGVSDLVPSIGARHL